ncbi:ArnT family glycosyltransferase [Streptomyces fagopyri]|uniref:ArnT family glycosyltransferase n=1 Tax=Streptomyces fagopyri TaxID=2662397 RepID=UPI0037FCB6FE
MTAREFGGARRAQLLAAVATGTMPVLLGGAHVANTTSYEVLAWAAIALVVVRIGRTGETRWWLAAGALVGIGAEFNHLAAVFGVVLLAAVLLGPARRTAVDRRLLAGAALAVLLVLPDLWWQVRHGWAMFEMTRVLNGENGGPGNILSWIVGQLGRACLAMMVLWVAGLRFLWRSGRPLWRCLVTVYAVLFVLFVLFAVTIGAQVYYLGGLYVCLLAAGAVGLDGWLHSRPDQLRGLLAGQAGSQLSSTARSAISHSGCPSRVSGRRGLDSHCPTGRSSAVADSRCRRSASAVTCACGDRPWRSRVCQGRQAFDVTSN